MVMLLLSVLLAVTLNTTNPTTVTTCQITGIVQESEPAVAPATAPERISVKLTINSSESKCAEDFPKNTLASFFVVKNNIKPGDSFTANTKIEGSAVYTYKDAASLESYKILPPEEQGATVRAGAPTVAQKESFFSWLINAIKRLFGGK